MIETLDEYQDAVKRTSNPVTEFSKEYPMAAHVLGLTGEAGEVADIIKKIHAHGHEFTAAEHDKLEKELGDVMWYISALATDLNLNLSCIARSNIRKLEARYPNKFSIEGSVNRNT